MEILGIDLAGKPENPTGISILNVPNLETLSPDLKFKLLYKDGEILREIKKLKPDLIAIDAPLSLPRADAVFQKIATAANLGDISGKLKLR